MYQDPLKIAQAHDMRQAMITQLRDLAACQIMGNVLAAEYQLSRIQAAQHAAKYPPSGNFDGREPVQLEINFGACATLAAVGANNLMAALGYSPPPIRGPAVGANGAS